jgi:Uma2 family endonuclease
MSHAEELRRWTIDEYLAAEELAFEKSEYYDGSLVAMAGAPESHNLIVANSIFELRKALEGRPCVAFPSDMKVWLREEAAFVYPDVVVVCGPREYRDTGRNVLLNPTLVVEVLSDSTENRDLGLKFYGYASLASITDIVYVRADRVSVMHYSRGVDGSWTLRFLSTGDQFAPGGASIAVDSLYRDVEFTPPTPAPSS